MMSPTVGRHSLSHCMLFVHNVIGLPLLLVITILLDQCFVQKTSVLGIQIIWEYTVTEESWQAIISTNFMPHPFLSFWESYTNFMLMIEIYQVLCHTPSFLFEQNIQIFCLWVKYTKFYASSNSFLLNENVQGLYHTKSFCFEWNIQVLCHNRSYSFEQNRKLLCVNHSFSFESNIQILSYISSYSLDWNV